MKKFISLLLFLLIPLAWSNAGAATRIVMNSDSGDYIGGGTSYDFAGPFTVTINDRSVNISDVNGWLYEFVAPDNRVLEEGVYVGAERAPFRGPLNPGISVSSPGRGCNTIAGEFYIHEITVDDTSPTLALDFVQRCEEGTAALNGSIRIDSSVDQLFANPIAVNNTPSVIYEGEAAELDASGSFSGGADIVAFQWQQLSGPSVLIVDANAEQTTLQISEPVNLGGEVISLSLTVTDANSQVDTIQFTIDVASKSDPRSYFTMNSQAGDYIGQGQTWSYDAGNSVITASRNFANGVSVTIDSGDYWSADFAAADDAQLETGMYSSATRFPFQESGVPGVNISGDGRGCNNQFGDFTVEQLIWEGDEVASFKATFGQRCESTNAPLLTGEVAFNAYHVSVPTADAGDDVLVGEGQVVNLDGSDSFDAVGVSFQYAWSIANSSIVISNADQSRASFMAPSLDDREDSRDIEVELALVDDEGFVSKDTVLVTVTEANVSPSAVDDSVSINVGDVLALEPLNNDTDLDGELRFDSITVSQAPVNGLVVINSNGTIQYTHTSGNTETDSFSYTVEDNDGALSNEATFTIFLAMDTGGTDTDGTDTGGADAGGADAGGIDTGGIDTGGADAGGTETSGPDTDGTETSGTDTDGTDTNGTDTNGTDTNGTDTNGGEVIDNVSGGGSGSGSFGGVMLMLLSSFVIAVRRKRK